MASSNYIIEQVKAIKESTDQGVRVGVQEMAALPIWDIKSTNEVTEIFTTTQGMSGARALGELEEPDIAKLTDGYKVTATMQRYGTSFLISTTDMEYMKDDTTKVADYLVRQRDSAVIDVINLLVVNLHKFLNEAFSSTATYLAPDGLSLCNANHAWNNSTITFSNTGTAKFSQTAYEAARFAGASIKDSAGKPFVQNYKHLVVATASPAAQEAKRLYANGVQPVQYNDVNLYAGAVNIIETPYISSANAAYWFMLDDSRLSSPLHVGMNKYPTMGEPVLEKNGAVTTLVEGFWSQVVKNMPVNLYGSDGTV